MAALNPWESVRLSSYCTLTAVAGFCFRKHKRQKSVEGDTISLTNGQHNSPPPSDSAVSRSSSFGSTKQLIAGKNPRCFTQAMPFDRLFVLSKQPVSFWIVLLSAVQLVCSSQHYMQTQYKTQPVMKVRLPALPYQVCYMFEICTNLLKFALMCSSRMPYQPALFSTFSQHHHQQDVAAAFLLWSAAFQDDLQAVHPSLYLVHNSRM